MKMDYQKHLYAPKEYWTLTPADKAEVVNGCGPGGWKYDLIPDTMWGLDVSEACNIHDYMYYIGVTEKDKVLADGAFRENLRKIVEMKSRLWILKKLRLRRAETYYVFVSNFGDSAFGVKGERLI
jgi:hypothetical protein